MEGWRVQHVANWFAEEGCRKVDGRRFEEIAFQYHLESLKREER